MKKLFCILYKKIWLVALVIMLAINICHAESKLKPQARANHSAVYDSTNKQMIIFGGYNKTGLLSDTWILDIDKKTWKEIPSAEGHERGEKTPSPRWHHSAIYDSANKQMVIFGGSVEGIGIHFLNDIWVFDIENKIWKEIEESDKIPPQSFKHSAVYDPVNKQMIIFGGWHSGNYFSDLWIFNIEKKTWEEIELEKTPFPRSNHSAIYDPMGKQMLIFGGRSINGEISDMWRFDIAKKVWKEVEIEGDFPNSSQNNTAVYDSANKQIIISGGTTEGLFVTWAFDIEKSTWEKIKAKKAPPARYNHSAIYDSANKQIIIFGGITSLSDELSDTWAFDIEKATWSELTPVALGGRILIAVMDNEGNPIEGAKINIDRGGKKIEGMTDKEGKYEMRITEADSYEIKVIKDGFEEKEIKVEAKLGEEKEIEFRIGKK